MSCELTVLNYVLALGGIATIIIGGAWWFIYNDPEARIEREEQRSKES